VQVVQQPQQHVYAAQPQQQQQVYVAQQPPPQQQVYAAQPQPQYVVVQPLQYVAQTVQQGRPPENAPPCCNAECGKKCGLLSLVVLLALVAMPSDQDISVPSLQDATRSIKDSVYAATYQCGCSTTGTGTAPQGSCTFDGDCGTIEVCDESGSCVEDSSGGQTSCQCGFDLSVRIESSNYFEHEATLLVRVTHTGSGFFDATKKMLEGRWEGVVQSRPVLGFSSPVSINVHMQQPDSTGTGTDTFGVSPPWSCDSNTLGCRSQLDEDDVHDACADDGQFEVALEGWLNYTSPMMRNQRFEDQTYVLEYCHVDSTSSAPWPHSTTATLPVLAVVSFMTFMSS
jgi:hypothetical protein